MDADWTVPGHNDRYDGLRSTGVAPRPWLTSFPICRTLEKSGILHLGVGKTDVPYKVQRKKQAHHYLLACHSGEGRILLDDTWMPCTQNMAFFLPAGMSHAFRAHGKWQFGWVCFSLNSSLPTRSPQARYGLFPSKRLCVSISRIIQGVVAKEGETACAERIDQIIADVAEFLDGDPIDSISQVWSIVSRSPQLSWSLDDLCLKAGCSKRELRDWALRSFGRPPMRQIFHLRLVRAAQLLISGPTDEELVAQQTGFPSLKAFRAAFVRWAGQAPNAYRRRME